MVILSDGIRPLLAARRYNLAQLAPELARFKTQVDSIVRDMETSGLTPYN